MPPDQPRPASWQYTAYPLQSLTEADRKFQVSKFGRIVILRRSMPPATDGVAAEPFASACVTDRLSLSGRLSPGTPGPLAVT